MRKLRHRGQQWHADAVEIHMVVPDLSPRATQGNWEQCPTDPEAQKLTDEEAGTLWERTGPSRAWVFNYDRVSVCA